MTVKKTKLTFEEAERAFPVLTFETKNSIKGGCGHCEGWEEEGATVYTQEEYSYLSSQSLWAGGNVCGIGYVPSQTSESEITTDAPMSDGMDSTIDDGTTTIPDESGTTGEPEIIPDDPADDVPTDTTDDPTTTIPNEPETTGEPDEDGTKTDNDKGNDVLATPDPVPYASGNINDIEQALRDWLSYAKNNEGSTNLGDFFNQSDGNLADFDTVPGYERSSRNFKLSNGNSMKMNFWDATVGGDHPQNAWQNDIHSVETLNDGGNFQIRFLNNDRKSVGSIQFQNEQDMMKYYNSL